VVLVIDLGDSSEYLEDFTKNYPGVWIDGKFSGNMPQHVDAGVEGPNQGVVTTELLHDDVGHTDRGPGVA
jgi:hypothetical protein